MNETEKKKSQTLMILGLIALIAVLVLGVKVVFAGLMQALPQPEPSLYTPLTDEAGQSVPYGARLLTGEENQGQDIQKWLESAGEWLGAGDERRKDRAFWLYRKDRDEYVLYLPEQDRTLTAADVTASEEKEEDGETALVLRVRTPEGSERTTPEEQLFALKTTSDQWKGIRLKVVVDGREKEVQKLVFAEGGLFSTEEVYIGRDV